MSEDLEVFRRTVRQWLAQNCPESMRGASGEPAASDDSAYWGGRNPEVRHPDQKVWADRMGAQGWTAPEWPKDYGGGGLSKVQAIVLREEMQRIGARDPLVSFGISMLGPALLRFGSEEQKQRYLPPIVRGEIRWCQGYSEPGAGSDLANLQTRAEDCGDHYRINGQKVWTSYADKADWMFCLVRTDSSGSKHEGISFLLFDMQTPGITTRPIRLISGQSPFCETFFDNVRVPKENLVGQVGKGWTIAKYLLGHEREMIGHFGRVSGPSLPEEALAHIGQDAAGRLDSSALRARLAQYELDAWAFAKAVDLAEQAAGEGAGLGDLASAFKYYGTELNKRRNELRLTITGASGLAWRGAEQDGAIARAWLRSKGNSIEGGTSEIQLSIIAKRLLGLPA